jgi:hypothetical protein
MLEIIDLSQEIFSDMPVFPGLPEVKNTTHVSHEQWDGITDRDLVSPAVNRLELGEHTVTPFPFISGKGLLQTNQQRKRHHFSMFCFYPVPSFLGVELIARRIVSPNCVRYG